MIVLILYLTHKSWIDALLMMTSVLGALAGGAIFQWLFGFHFSVAVQVGYIACFGMAVETGVVMLVYLHEAIDERGGLERIGSIAELRQAILEGAIHRLRPKLLTEGAAIISIAPMLWATGVGAEVIRPMAAPVLGGLLIADEVIDVFLPVLYFAVQKRRWRKLHGVSLLNGQAAVVGPHPAPFRPQKSCRAMARNRAWPVQRTTDVGPPRGSLRAGATGKNNVRWEDLWNATDLVQMDSAGILGWRSLGNRHILHARRLWGRGRPSGGIHRRRWLRQGLLMRRLLWHGYGWMSMACAAAQSPAPAPAAPMDMGGNAPTAAPTGSAAITARPLAGGSFTCSPCIPTSPATAPAPVLIVAWPLPSGHEPNR